MTSYAYDSGYIPPLPVIPVNLRTRPTDPPVQLAMIVDTGADHPGLKLTYVGGSSLVHPLGKPNPDGLGHRCAPRD
jgi:hypothetical protein